MTQPAHLHDQPAGLLKRLSHKCRISVAKCRISVVLVSENCRVSVGFCRPKSALSATKCPENTTLSQKISRGGFGQTRPGPPDARPGPSPVDQAGGWDTHGSSRPTHAETCSTTAPKLSGSVPRPFHKCPISVPRNRTLSYENGTNGTVWNSFRRRPLRNPTARAACAAAALAPRMLSAFPNPLKRGGDA